MSEKDARIFAERLGKYRVPICIRLGARRVGVRLLRVASWDGGAVDEGGGDPDASDGVAGGGSRRRTDCCARERNLDRAGLSRSVRSEAAGGADGANFWRASQAAEASGLVLLNAARTGNLVRNVSDRRHSPSGDRRLQRIRGVPDPGPGTAVRADQIQECRLSAETPEGEGPNSLDGTDPAIGEESDRGDLAGSFVFSVFAGSADYSVQASPALRPIEERRRLAEASFKLMSRLGASDRT